MVIFLYPNFEKSHSKECTQKACEILSSLGCKILMPSDCKTALFIDGVGYMSPEEAAKNFDIMISVGGDGTILKCAGLASKTGRELLGINCGRLGFMASLEREELSLLGKLVSGDYTVEERMMLEVSIERKSGNNSVLTALNEAVISGGYGSGIQDFAVYADGLQVSSLRADGLIFSTPTGASAYSLSAGGPLIEPTLDCIEFTQICPHSLFARTMLFSPEKLIEVRFKTDGECAASVSVDGRAPEEITETDRLTIKRSQRRLKLIDICGGAYFRAINSKLMQPVKAADENASDRKADKYEK